MTEAAEVKDAAIVETVAMEVRFASLSCCGHMDSERRTSCG